VQLHRGGLMSIFCVNFLVEPGLTFGAQRILPVSAQRRVQIPDQRCWKQYSRIWLKHFVVG
jgi:hypothetical protein